MKITKTHIRYLLILAQVLIWIGIIWAMTKNQQIAENMLVGFESPPAIYALWICFPFMLLINVNWYFLAPKYLKKGTYVKYSLYVIATILVCAFMLSLNSSINQGNEMYIMVSDSEDQLFIPAYLVNAYLFFMVYLVSMPFYLSLGWFEQQSEIKKLENESLKNELDNLRSQINPHFFFNTLNNLYALSLENSEKAPDAILKLSELMRYVIYDASKDVVTIREEVDYLENFFELQKLRLSNHADIQFKSKIDDSSTLVIPLLFINLLENAFKHGAESMITQGNITCSLLLEKGHLHFRVKNQYEENEEKRKGKGLDNLKRRLALAYPNRHSLIIKDESGIFDVSLIIDIENEVPRS